MNEDAETWPFQFTMSLLKQKYLVWGYRRNWNAAIEQSSGEKHCRINAGYSDQCSQFRYIDIDI